MLCVRLLKEVCAFNKHCLHFIVDGIAGRVEHTQIQPELDGLVGKFIPAKDRPLEVDIGKKCVNLLGRTQERKRLVYVAGRNGIVTPVLDHHLRIVAEKHIIFDDQYHGHQNCFCRDNQNRDYPSSSAGITAIGAPSERYQG
jgi:hypothetical protein